MRSEFATSRWHHKNGTPCKLFAMRYNLVCTKGRGIGYYPGWPRGYLRLPFSIHVLYICLQPPLNARKKSDSTRASGFRRPPQQLVFPRLFSLESYKRVGKLENLVDNLEILLYVARSRLVYFHTTQNSQQTFACVVVRDVAYLWL